MHESSKNLQACLVDMYEQDWDGKNEVDSIAEVRKYHLNIEITEIISMEWWVLFLFKGHKQQQ